MGIFKNFKAMVSERVEALQEKKAFLRDVENEAKPIRRAAYLEQVKDQAVLEGRLLAQKAVDKKIKPKAQPISEEAKKQVEDQWAVSDPFKYLNKSGTKNGN